LYQCQNRFIEREKLHILLEKKNEPTNATLNQQIKEKKIGSESLQNENKKIIYTEPSSEINSLRKQNFLQKQNI